jgi:hypothetical protein
MPGWGRYDQCIAQIGGRPWVSPEISRICGRKIPACRPSHRFDVADGADFGKLIAEETEKWGKVVEFSGAKTE